MTQLIMTAAILTVLLCLATAINIKLNRVLDSLKSDFSVKTQMLQDELHEVYLRAVKDANKRRNRRKRRIHANTRLNL